MIITPAQLLDDIESFTLGGRSLQVEIGVSEVGMTCQRCVARKMGEYEKTRLVSSFRTTIGRYVHEGLERDFGNLYSDKDMVREEKLLVHAYRNWILRGSSDVFLPNEGVGTVLDWKVVGDDTLSAMRKRAEKGELPKEQYVTQGHLYGLGWTLKDYDVKNITIMFLPANKGDLKRYAVPFTFPFDPSHAARALAHVELMIDEARQDGWAAVVQRRDPEPGCLSCPQYEQVDNPVFDLLLDPKKREMKKRMFNERIRNGQSAPRLAGGLVLEV